MAEKRVIELEVKDNVPNLKQQYKEAVKEVQKLVQVYGETSQQVAEAAKRAAELKDQIEDTNDAIAAFKGEGTYAAFGKAISSVASGFSAVEGAMGLVGVESEALQETLLRVQSAMALAQGLEGLEDAGRAFKQVGAIATNAFNNMSKASKAFAITGIGLLITAVAALVANWDSVAKKLGLVNEKQDALNSTMDAYREGAKQAIQQTTEVANSFELARQGVISKEEALFVYNETLGDSFGKAKNLNEAEALYAKKTDAYIKATALRAQAQALFAKAADEQVKALTANMEDQTGILDKAQAGLTSYFFGVKAGGEQLIKSQKEATKEVERTSKRKSKALNDLASDLLKEAELIEKKNGIVSENEKKTQDAIVKKKKETTQKVIEETRKQGEITQEQEDFFTQMLVDSEAEKQKIRDEAKAKQEEEELMLMQFKGDLYKQDVDNFDAAEAKKKKLREDNLKSSVKAGVDALNLIASIAEMNAGEDEARQKKAFGIRKAANIASATIDGYKAVLSTYADTPGGPVVKGIAAAIAGAFAALQIASIAKQEFNGGASASAGGGGGVTTPSGAGGSVITPNFNIVGNAQATNPLAGLGNQPLQAYVVSGEVTTAQNLDRNRINYATFG